MKMVLRSQLSYFLQIPEEIIRLIFGYLDDNQLFFSVRPVCAHLKRIVDTTLRLGM